MKKKIQDFFRKFQVQREIKQIVKAVEKADAKTPIKLPDTKVIKGIPLTDDGKTVKITKKPVSAEAKAKATPKAKATSCGANCKCGKHGKSNA